RAWGRTGSPSSGSCSSSPTSRTCRRYSPRRRRWRASSTPTASSRAELRIVLQRAARASVRVRGETVASIDAGLLLLVGIGHDEGEDVAERLAEKIVHLRVFEDADGKMNLALSDVGGEILVV